MTFPSGYVAQYIVPNSSLESSLSRVKEVKLGHANNFVTVATYDYLGTGGVVGTTLPEPDVFGRRYNTSGDYVQLDRWNRPTTWTWTKDLTADIDFYDVGLAYNERGDILRTIDNVMADTAGTRFFDRAYTLDALGRVLGETRGDWDGSAIGTTREDRNWASRDYDLDGLGTDFAEDNTPIGTHFDNANEWIKRNITTGGSPVDPLYDANGNLTDDDKDSVYTYDAWNRLTSISTTGGSPTLVAEYRYNGLGQRIAEGDGTDTEQLMYDDRWRLVSRHDGTSYTEEIVHHHAGLDGFGGASDVDSVIMRRTFLSTGTPQTESKRWYVLQNWRQDPAVTVSDAGVQRERAFFSPYGRVFGLPAGDVSFEGEFGAGDGTTISGWSTAYRAHADVNLDGTIDAADATGNTHATLGWDALSRDGSTIGYAGYVQDSSIPTLSHVRHRAYKSDLGRWVQRDPAGYVDGASLYEYARSSPVVFVDWSGLASRVGLGGSCSGAIGVDSCGSVPGGGTDPTYNPELGNCDKWDGQYPPDTWFDPQRIPDDPGPGDRTKIYRSKCSKYKYPPSMWPHHSKCWERRYIINNYGLSTAITVGICAVEAKDASDHLQDPCKNAIRHCRLACCLHTYLGNEIADDILWAHECVHLHTTKNPGGFYDDSGEDISWNQVGFGCSKTSVINCAGCCKSHVLRKYPQCISSQGGNPADAG